MKVATESMAVNPRDVYAAAEAAAEVVKAVKELAGIEQELPALIRMDWYSPAAAEFTTLLRQSIGNVSTTLEDLQTCAGAVARHVEELRALGHEVP
ncbi:hypothetical protein QMA10_02025 [Arthrobacter sp. APC 3897]|uniref:hypothetical protein n=1 Tax=Arthrobacter sp. APC 3897 TaxID=3035204 RepID=UPI0025B53F25|nr:hypothetical protein [Arthrobacter sp. APC 3897]MDN3480704.1 hypothetical protein [Arthrobacter sp. APC 3897]